MTNALWLNLDKNNLRIISLRSLLSCCIRKSFISLRPSKTSVCSHKITHRGRTSVILIHGLKTPYFSLSFRDYTNLTQTLEVPDVRTFIAPNFFQNKYQLGYLFFHVTIFFCYRWLDHFAIAPISMPCYFVPDNDHASKI